MSQTVLHFIDSASFGGAEQMVLHLLGGLDRRCWRPVLFHHPEPGLAPLIERARHMDIAVQAVPRMPLGLEGAKYIPSFMRALREEQPVVFHAHLTWPLSCKHALTAAILARTPAIVATVHLFVNLPYSRLTRIQQRLLAAGIQRYIAVSREVAQQIHHTFNIPEHKIQVIYNSIPASGSNRSPNAALRATLTAKKGQLIVLTVARLDEQKGHRYLLEAAAQVSEALFVLVGDGPERAKLEARVQERGLSGRVRFLGYRQDVADLLAVCDLFVLPSLYEGLPLSVLEAMVAGKPVIATAIGGTDEAIVHGETGFLVPPRDARALACAIETVLDNPGLARQLAVAGQVHVLRNFPVKIMVRRVADLYHDLLNGGLK